MIPTPQTTSAAMVGFRSGEDEGVTIDTLTQYLPDAGRLAEREAALRVNFAKNLAAGTVLGTLESRALEVARSIATPIRYVEFGPYWWAVKAALNAAGDDLGDATDEIVRTAYSGDTDLRTLIAATDFAEFYRSRYFAGTRVFDLGDLSADGYELADEDMDDRSR